MGDISEIEWQEVLKPLLVAIDERSAASEICQVTIGDIGGGIHHSNIAGRDVIIEAETYIVRDAKGDVVSDYIAGEKILGDKVVHNITHLVQQAVTATEEAEKSRAIAVQRLAEGVRRYAQILATITSQDILPVIILTGPVMRQGNDPLEIKEVTP